MEEAVKTHDEEIAELTLRLEQSEQRWKMNNRMCNDLLTERMNIVHQLYAHGLTVDGSGNVVKTGDKDGS